MTCDVEERGRERVDLFWYSLKHTLFYPTSYQQLLLASSILIVKFGWVSWIDVKLGASKMSASRTSKGGGFYFFRCLQTAITTAYSNLLQDGNGCCSIIPRFFVFVSSSKCSSLRHPALVFKVVSTSVQVCRLVIFRHTLWKFFSKVFSCKLSS
jgi:hypothetical protein